MSESDEKPADGRGRPPFKPKRGQAERVRLLKAAGWSNDDVAGHFRIDRKTLEKYFPHELKYGAAEKKAEALGWLEKMAKKNASALRMYLDRIDGGDLLSRDNPKGRDAGAGAAPEGDRPQEQRATTAARPGKKQLEAEAALAPDRTTEMGRLMAQRQGSPGPRGRPN